MLLNYKFLFSILLQYHPSHGYRVVQPTFDEIQVADLTPATVGAGLKLEMDYEVTEPETKLR